MMSPTENTESVWTTRRRLILTVGAVAAILVIGFLTLGRGDKSKARAAGPGGGGAAAGGQPAMPPMPVDVDTARLRPITDAVRRCVEHLSPDLASDVFTDGAAMVGGGALLPGWPQRLREAMGLKLRIPDEPLTCVMRGLVDILHHREKYEELIANSKVRASLE